MKKLEYLINKFHNNFYEYKSRDYNETELRADFINPFLEQLGWDIYNKRRLPQHLRDVKQEASVIVEERGVSTKKYPDYEVRLTGEKVFFIETKKPEVDLINDAKSSFQLRRYGWNGNLNISILTNFEYLLIYDCTIRPTETDNSSIGLIKKYHYTEYLNKWNEIMLICSKKSVIDGSSSVFLSNIDDIYDKMPFDEFFLNQIRGWRLCLAKDIIHNNGEVNEELLNIFIQKILNRIIFLRICEDREFEKYETLKEISTYEELREIFLKADEKYDSGLFHLIDSEEIKISDNVVIDIFKELYYPNSSYEFSIVDPYIIGNIYSLFLGEYITVEDGYVVEKDKPEVIISQGVVNTPKKITDKIVNDALSIKIKDKDIKDIIGLKIADICCGAGNFLISAYEKLYNHLIQTMLLDEKRYLSLGLLIFNEISNEYHLSYEVKRNIVYNNIFGVDIDPMAVEVAKLSLLLKILEGETRESLNAYMNKSKNRILPNLDKNIQLGNSLLDDSYFKFKKDVVLEDLFKLKLFNWDKSFKHKFDVIVGNPPYIRVQNMKNYSKSEYDYYRSSKSPYYTSIAPALDKYFLFIERAMSLLVEDGVLGYIIPNKFMTIKSGEALRHWIVKNKFLRSIYHFGTNQVFKGRSTYTCILILENRARDNYNIFFVDDLNKFLITDKYQLENHTIDSLTEEPWIYLEKNIREIINGISEESVSLDEICDIFVGMQTSKDDVYIIDPIEDLGDFIKFKDKNGLIRKIEKNILKPCIYDISISKYKEIEYNAYMIFPYKMINNKIQLISVEQMKKKYKNAYEYLLYFKDELENRSMTRKSDEDWFQFGRNQSIKKFIMNKERLVWPVLSTDSNYVYDDKGIVFTGGGNGPFYGLQMKEYQDISIKYIQAMLNHRILESVVRSSASKFRGDYYSHGKQFISKLPIIVINFNDEYEVNLYNNIIKSVEELEEISLKFKLEEISSKKNIIIEYYNFKNNRLNEIIEDLYEYKHK